MISAETAASNASLGVPTGLKLSSSDQLPTKEKNWKIGRQVDQLLSFGDCSANYLGFQKIGRQVDQPVPKSSSSAGFAIPGERTSQWMKLAACCFMIGSSMSTEAFIFISPLSKMTIQKENRVSSSSSIGHKLGIHHHLDEERDLQSQLLRFQVLAFLHGICSQIQQLWAFWIVKCEITDFGYPFSSLPHSKPEIPETVGCFSICSLSPQSHRHEDQGCSSQERWKLRTSSRSWTKTRIYSLSILYHAKSKSADELTQKQSMIFDRRIWTRLWRDIGENVSDHLGHV